jgi:hypothetical protein
MTLWYCDDVIVNARFSRLSARHVGDKKARKAKRHADFKWVGRDRFEYRPIA